LPLWFLQALLFLSGAMLKTKSHANQRLDRYGGSAENRCRFPLEVFDAIISVWGPRKVGINICPTDDYNDSTTTYTELQETYSYYIKELMARELGFINLSRRGCQVGREQDDYFHSDDRPKGMELPKGYEPIHEFGHLIKHEGSKILLMVNHEYTVEEGHRLITERKVDLVSFGRPFIYNPVSLELYVFWLICLSSDRI
jgi:2,4-dienoyl-CoA reductase-like NADH-dependent reductase (Old Yellow Enzyme family)